MRFSDTSGIEVGPGGGERMFVAGATSYRTASVETGEEDSIEEFSRYVTSMLGALHFIQSADDHPVKMLAMGFRAMRTCLWRAKKSLGKHQTSLIECHRPNIPQFSGQSVASYHEHAIELCRERDRYIWSLLDFGQEDRASADDYFRDGSEVIAERWDKDREKFLKRFPVVDLLELDRLVDLELSRAQQSEELVLLQEVLRKPIPAFRTKSGMTQFVNCTSIEDFRKDLEKLVGVLSLFVSENNAGDSAMELARDAVWNVGQILKWFDIEVPGWYLDKRVPKTMEEAVCVLGKIERMLQDGDDEAVTGDSELTVSHEFHPPEQVKPRWDREKSVLMYDGEEIRKIRPNAKKPIVILNAFEEDGWPLRIDSPIPSSEDLSRPVRTLNEKLKKIKFTRDGTGEGVKWELQ
ncbi:MAG: hypothetical protein Tsb009_36210 [Planctomycetaceae bacterium]